MGCDLNETNLIKPDADEVLRVAELTLAELRNTNAGNLRPVELLEELYSQTRERIENGVAPEDAQLTALDWMRLVTSSADSEKAGRYIRDNVRKLNEYLEEHSETIISKLRDSGCQRRLEVSNTASKGGKGNKNYYYLSLTPLDGTNGAEALTPKGGVRYRVRSLDQPYFWAKPFLQIDVEGLKILFTLGVVLAPILGVILLFKVIFSGGGFLVITVLMMICMLLFSIARPFNGMLDYQIVNAPIWLYNLRTLSAQFELVATGRFRQSGRPVKSIRLVIYEGECGVCHAPLEIVEGKREFKTRLIGRCTRAGGEHIYSFDHVTKVGVPLRENAYYG